MNEAQTSLAEPGKQMDNEDFSLIDILIVLAKRKKSILGVPLAVAIVSASLSLLLPNIYQASTKLLPPQQAQSGAAALLSQLGGMAGAAAGAAGIKNPNELYVGMLRSRTVADRVIAKFNLMKVYSSDSLDSARKKLEANTTITSGKDGLITIAVEDKSQKLVAPLTNSYVEELRRLTGVLAVTEASQRRMFFEQQLVLAKNNLAKVEISLKGALNSRGVISVDSESAAIVATTARLRAELSAKQIELNSMRAFVTTSNPKYRLVEEQLNSLQGELSKLENGADSGSRAPTAVTQSGLENIQLLRDLKYYQMMYELLAKQYEVARLDEAKEPSAIQVLDPAIEPEKKLKPSRALIVLILTLSAFFAAIIWAFVAEAKAAALSRPHSALRWGEFKSSLGMKK